jgi:hypothetical protein
MQVIGGNSVKRYGPGNAARDLAKVFDQMNAKTIKDLRIVCNPPAYEHYDRAEVRRLRPDGAGLLRWHGEVVAASRTRHDPGP